MGGCPNSCSQYQLGHLGLAGCALHDADGRLYPAYQLTLGGGVGPNGTRYGRSIGKLPAKAVPEAVRRLVQRYLAERLQGEDFVGYLDRVGIDAAKALLADLQPVPAFGEHPEYYVDWGAARFFSLDERGEGECAV